MPVLFSVPMMSVDMKAADTAAASLLREDKTHPNLMDVSRHGTIYTTATDLQAGGTPTRANGMNTLPALRKKTTSNNRTEQPHWLHGSKEKTGFEATEVHKFLRRYRVMYRGPQYSLIGSRQMMQMVRGPVVPAERLVHPTYSLVRGGTLVEVDSHSNGGAGGSSKAANLLRIPDSASATTTSLAAGTHQTEPPTRSATSATATANAFLTESQSVTTQTKTNPSAEPVPSTHNGVVGIKSGSRKSSQWRLVKLPAKLRMRAETLRRHGEYTGKQYYSATDLPRNESRYSQLLNVLLDEPAMDVGGGAVGGDGAAAQATRVRGGDPRVRHKA